jgi:hypothetical protein
MVKNKSIVFSYVKTDVSGNLFPFSSFNNAERDEETAHTKLLTLRLRFDAAELDQEQMQGSLMGVWGVCGGWEEPLTASGFGERDKLPQRVTRTLKDF